MSIITYCIQPIKCPSGHVIVYYSPDTVTWNSCHWCMCDYNVCVCKLSVTQGVNWDMIWDAKFSWPMVRALKVWLKDFYSGFVWFLCIWCAVFYYVFQKGDKLVSVSQCYSKEISRWTVIIWNIVMNSTYYCKFWKHSPIFLPHRRQCFSK